MNNAVILIERELRKEQINLQYMEEFWTDKEHLCISSQRKLTAELENAVRRLKRNESD